MVDARRLIPAHEVADLVGCADRTAQRPCSLLDHLGGEGVSGLGADVAVEAEQRTLLLELLPDVCDAGPVLADGVVVDQRVPEEVAAVEASLDGLFLVGVQHHRHDARQVGVDGEAAGNTLI